MSDSSVALITGGGRRLGRQIGLALARTGFDIVVNYCHSREHACKTVADIQRLGVRSIGIQADVARESDVKTLVGTALDEFGQIDVLVNNAAVFTTVAFSKTSEETWDTTLDINLKGAFLCSQMVAEAMLKRGKGRMVNMASLGGMQAWARHIPYCVSKAGLIMLTKCLAKELAPCISVNAIAPGTIVVPGEESAEVQHIGVEKIPLHRYGSPSDVTDVVVFLATAAEYITGQVFVVDGGRSIA